MNLLSSYLLHTNILSLISMYNYWTLYWCRLSKSSMHILLLIYFANLYQVKACIQCTNHILYVYLYQVKYVFSVEIWFSFVQLYQVKYVFSVQIIFSFGYLYQVKYVFIPRLASNTAIYNISLIPICFLIKPEKVNTISQSITI